MTPKHKDIKPGGLMFVGLYKRQGDEPLYFHDMLYRIASEVGLKAIAVMAHEFDNGGTTAVAILAESHLVLEYWPEGLMYVFLASCKPFLENKLDGLMAEKGFVRDHGEVRHW